MNRIVWYYMAPLFRARGTFALAVAIVASLHLANTASAQQRSILDDDTELRLQEIELDARLRLAHKQARIWHWSWIGFLSGAFAAQGVLTGVANEGVEDRLAQSLSAVPPVVGLSLQLAMPIAALSFPEDRGRLKKSAGRNREKRIEAKRELMRKYAQSERKQRNWFAHAGPLFLHTSIAATLLFLFEKPVDAAIQMAVGVVTTELKIWTSPRAAGRANAENRRRLAAIPRVAPVVARSPLRGRYWGVSLLWESGGL